MIIKMDTDFVMNKMKELCSAILEQESYIELRSKFDAFLTDEESINQYDRFTQIQHTLQQKEQTLGLSEEEIAQYEKEELAIYDNPIIREFLNAQREFNDVHSLISQYFTKTIEFNRLPTSSELKKGGCGCGGACGGH